MNKCSLILNILVDLWKSLVDLGRGHFGKKKPFFWKFCQNVGPTTTYSNAATNRKVWILIKLGLSSLVKYFNQFIINFDILGEMIMF
jgi:hypothetical protein